MENTITRRSGGKPVAVVTLSSHELDIIRDGVIMLSGAMSHIAASHPETEVSGLDLTEIDIINEMAHTLRITSATLSAVDDSWVREEEKKNG